MTFSRTLKIIPLFIIFIMSISTAHADWVLDQEKSSLSFGSIKKNSIGESNHFRHLEGRITEDGHINLLIDLSSIETRIDIRNARMKEFLFQVTGFPAATLKGEIDMGKFKKLKTGGQMSFDMSFDFNLHGQNQTLDVELTALRLSEKTVVVVPDGIIFLDAEKFDLLPGLKKLKELAKLPSISSAIPVVFHLTFNQVP